MVRIASQPIFNLMTILPLNRTRNLVYCYQESHRSALINTAITAAPRMQIESAGIKVERSNPMDVERRRQKRRRFTYYMPVLDANTLQVVGHLSDISPIGIRLGQRTAAAGQRELSLARGPDPEMANKTAMIFNGRSRWCAMISYRQIHIMLGSKLTSCPMMTPRSSSGCTRTTGPRGCGKRNPVLKVARI